MQLIIKNPENKSTYFNSIGNHRNQLCRMFAGIDSHKNHVLCAFSCPWWIVHCSIWAYAHVIDIGQQITCPLCLVGHARTHMNWIGLVSPYKCLYCIDANHFRPVRKPLLPARPPYCTNLLVTTTPRSCFCTSITMWRIAAQEATFDLAEASKGIPLYHFALMWGAGMESLTVEVFD